MVEPAVPTMIEDSEKEPLVYPEGAGGEVTDAEAALFERLEEMSPEEAFAAWEAMLAEDETEAEPTQVEAQLSAEMVTEETRIEAPEDEGMIEPPIPTVAEEAVAGEVEAEREVPDEERVEEVLPRQPVAEPDQAWMTLIEDEDLEETPIPSISEEVPELREVPEGVPYEAEGVLAHEEAPAVEPTAEEELPEPEITEAPVLAEEPAAEAMTELDEYEAEPWEELEPASDEKETPSWEPVAEAAEAEEEPEPELPEWATAEAVETAPDISLEATEDMELELALQREQVEDKVTAPAEPMPSDLEQPSAEVERPAEEEEIVEPELPGRPTWVTIEEEEEISPAAPEVPVAREVVSEPSDDQEWLEKARHLWSTGENKEAHKVYQRLLSTPLRDEVMADLEQITAEEPADEAILRLLGDAYMRDNRLQKALATYRRALSSL
jgi:hypothetical protein